METIEQLERDWDRYLESDGSKEEAEAHLDYLETQESFWNEIEPVSMSEKADIVEYLEDSDYENLRDYVREELR